MKKLVLIVLAISVGMMSCNKSDIKPATTVTRHLPANGFQGVSKSEKGFLKFKDRESYDAFLDVMKDLPESDYDTWEKQMNYTSLRTYMKTHAAAGKGTSTTTNYNEHFEDELFLTVIDEYGVVQIDDMIFKAETDIDFVWTLGADNLQNYGDLLGRTFDPATMNIFRISEDENRTAEVWDIVLAKTVGIDESNGQYKGTGIFGNDHKVNDDVYDASQSLTYRADCKSCYQTALFYYSLMTELKYMRKSNGNFSPWQQQSTNIWPSSASYCNYKSNKSGSSTQYPTHPGGVYDNKYNWRPYSASRGLRNYNIETYYYYTSQSPSNPGTRTVNVGVHK